MLDTILVALLLQAAPYRTGPVPEPVQPYEADSASSPYKLATAVAPPELARTGVNIEAYDRRIEARWGSDDPFYAATVRGGAAAAQGRQGALDGGWTLAAPNSGPLYAFQLSDPGEGTIDGAWQAIGSAGAPARAPSGFIALIGRESGRLSLRFMEPRAAQPTVVVVEPTADGSWRGELVRDQALPTPVIMRRR